MVDTGIAGYGVYLPRERISSELLLKHRESGNPRLGSLINRLKYGLLGGSKTIAGICEDSATMPYEAGGNAMRMAGLDTEDIGAIVVGTESKPYAVGTIATQVAEWLGIGPRKYAFDIECACNAGMQALSIIDSYVRAGKIDYGLGIGADVATSKRKDDLEYFAGAGAVAGIIGRENDDNGLVARLYRPELPYSTDYKDFFRRSGTPVPSHFGPTTADAYIMHCGGGVVRFLENYPNATLREFSRIVFHQPNGYMPKKTCKAFVEEEVEKIRKKKDKSLADLAVLRLSDKLKERGLWERAKLEKPDIKEKVGTTLIVREIGNPYAASTGIGLADALDKAQPGERILSISYGSGAHALVTPFEATQRLPEVRDRVPSVQDYLDRMVDVHIDTYKTLWKERIKRWAREHLVFKKTIAEIEPAEDNMGFLGMSVCRECGSIYTPKRKRCLHSNHDSKDLVELKLPYKAKLKSFRKSSWKQALREKSSDVLLDNKVILVDCGVKDLEEDMELEPVIRKLDHEGSEGLISYGWAYRPVFRDHENYTSRLETLEHRLSEAPLIS